MNITRETCPKNISENHNSKSAIFTKNRRQLRCGARVGKYSVRVALKHLGSSPPKVAKLLPL